MIFNRKKAILADVYETYNDCSELPLFNWIKLAVTGDHKWLLKSGTTNDDLSNIYDAIIAEYTSIIKDVRSTQEHKLKIAVNTLAKRIDHINIAVAQLRIERDERLIAILREQLGFSRLTYVDLDKDLDLTLTFIKSDIIKFEQKKIQLLALIEQAEESSDNGEVAAWENVTMLEKWLSISINAKDCSIMRYLVYLNTLKLEIKNNQIK